MMVVVIKLFSSVLVIRNTFGSPPSLIMPYAFTDIPFAMRGSAVYAILEPVRFCTVERAFSAGVVH